MGRRCSPRCSRGTGRKSRGAEKGSGRVPDPDQPPGATHRSGRLSCSGEHRGLFEEARVGFALHLRGRRGSGSAALAVGAASGGVNPEDFLQRSRQRQVLEVAPRLLRAPASRDVTAAVATGAILCCSCFHRSFPGCAELVVAAVRRPATSCYGKDDSLCRCVTFRYVSGLTPVQHPSDCRRATVRLHCHSLL